MTQDYATMMNLHTIAFNMLHDHEAAASRYQAEFLCGEAITRDDAYYAMKKDCGSVLNKAVDFALQKIREKNFGTFQSDCLTVTTEKTEKGAKYSIGI